MSMSHNGFWRVSVTILFVQKMMLKLKGLSGCLLNLVHWAKVKGNASINMCKMPYSTCCTITHSDLNSPINSSLTLVNPQNYYFFLFPWRSHTAASAAVGNTM